MRPAQLFITLLCGLAGSANAQTRPAAKSFAAQPPAHTAAAPDAWDTAFRDSSSNRSLHFTAHYVDAHNTTHRLEEWRIGQDHLRRLTDDRIDLHARTATHLPGQPREYLWTVLDLQKRVAHRISTVGMLRLGMLYSYYSMAHVLTRPAGQFTVQRTVAPGPLVRSTQLLLPANDTRAPRSPMANVGSTIADRLNRECTWYQITASGQPTQRVCWLAQYGVPARTNTQTAQGWRLDFQIDSLDTRPVPASNFVANTTGFQVRNVDELEAED